ncbi:MAG: hypothetical protein HXS54_18770 [Theionarchaea archaeon]|nr:hypothetical protein [Theionarchaea archaeon]
MNSNNDIQNAKTSILLPPLSFLKNAPFVMLSSGIVEKNVLLTYPMSLYTRDGNGKMNYLGFLYTFLFTGKDGEKTAFITYPLCFNDLYNQEIYERLLKEVEELRTAFKASKIVYEGFVNVSGELYNPLGVTGFGNIPNADFLDFVRTKGFEKTHVTTCYDVDWPINECDDISVYALSDFHERRQKYLELCLKSPSFMQLFDFESVMTRPPGIIERAFLRKDWVLFTERGNEKGCIKWFPQSVFKKDMKREAKIARLLFCDASPEFICASVQEAMNEIASHGFNRIQIGDIPKGSLIECELEKKGEKVCEIVYMTKQ